MESAAQHNNVVSIKVPPHDLDAEQAVLCGVLLDNRSIHKARKYIQAKDFYREAHQSIFEAMESLADHREAIDLITLADELRKRDYLEKVGGPEYLIALSQAVSTTAIIEHYAKIIKALSRRRSAILICSQVADRLYLPQEEPEDILSDLKMEIISIEGHGQTKTPQQIVDEVYRDIERRAVSGDHQLGVQTGFKAIDENTGGLEAGCTYVLKAKGHTGKSALALQIADNVAQENPEDLTLYITLESQATILTRRRMARMSGIALTRIRKANIHDEYEWERLTEAVGVCSQDNLWIVDDRELTSYPRLAAFCESLALERQLALLVIDHLQLLGMPGKFTSTHQEYKAISKQLNYLAMNLNAPLLIVSQVNKEGDAKESGDIYNNVDNEWALERDTKESEEARLICTKGKDTGLWRTTLHFDRYKQRYRDYKSTVPEV
jgi:replicative DNA helicase